MSYSTRQKDAQVMRKWFDDDESFERNRLGRWVKEASDMPGVLSWILKHKLQQLIIGNYPTEPKRDKETQVSLKNGSFPTLSDLEKVCEDIGKSEESWRRGIDVNFAGLVQHTYLTLGIDIANDEEGLKTLLYTVINSEIRLFPEQFEENSVEEYTVRGDKIYAPIKLWVPDGKIPSNDIIPLNQPFKFHPDTYIGGLVELRVHGRNDGNVKVYISPPDEAIPPEFAQEYREFNGTIHSESLRYDVATISSHFPPHLQGLQASVVDKLEKTLFS